MSVPGGVLHAVGALVNDGLELVLYAVGVLVSEHPQAITAQGLVPPVVEAMSVAVHQLALHSVGAVRMTQSGEVASASSVSAS